MILKRTGLKIDIGIGVGGLHCILCNVICLFQAQSRFGLVLSRGWVDRGGWGWVIIIETKANLG